MAEHKIERMTVAEFLAWEPADDQRYELVDGMPVAMTGARRAHDRLVVNALAAITPRLRGGPCEASTADIAVLIPNGNVRRPDVMVDCGSAGEDDQLGTKPVLVIEVLSRSTRNFDLLSKTLEYKSVSSILYILLVDPDDVAAILHRREPGMSWTDHVLVGPDTEVDLPAVPLSFRLGSLYPPAAA